MQGPISRMSPLGLYLWLQPGQHTLIETFDAGGAIKDDKQLTVIHSDDRASATHLAVYSVSLP